MDLIRHSMKNIISIYKEERNKEREGSLMVSPLTAVLAKLFVKDLEVREIMSAVLKLTISLKYADDKFLICGHGKREVDIFLNDLNNRIKKIKFIMAIEDNLQFSCLEVLVHNK